MSNPTTGILLATSGLCAAGWLAVKSWQCYNCEQSMPRLMNQYCGKTECLTLAALLASASGTLISLSTEVFVVSLENLRG